MTRYDELIKELGEILAKDLKADIEAKSIDEDCDVGGWIIDATQVNEDLTDSIYDALKELK